MSRLLQGALLLGAPFALSDCLLGTSSCPDNGTPPPLAESIQVSASLANGGPLTAADCGQVCAGLGDGVVTCVRESLESVLCIAHPFPCEGRRPPGLKVVSNRARNGLQCHLADAAWLEAASVQAFRVLREELRAHGAPRRLLRAASRATRDERRHARIAGALARRFDARVPAVERQAPPLRSLPDLALENAVEGCVRETWGALIALRQAKHATDPAVRAAMSRIAPDEVRHAELAWAIDRWLAARLTPAARRQVQRARASAVAQLSADVRVALPVAQRQILGLPGAEEAAQMLAALARSLMLVA